MFFLILHVGLEFVLCTVCVLIEFRFLLRCVYLVFELFYYVIVCVGFGCLLYVCCGVGCG